VSKSREAWDLVFYAWIFLIASSKFLNFATRTKALGSRITKIWYSEELFCERHSRKIKDTPPFLKCVKCQLIWYLDKPKFLTLLDFNSIQILLLFINQ